MPFSYANALSGPSAGSIGWCDFTGFNLNAGSPASNFSGTLKDGTTVSFTIQNVNSSGALTNYVPTATPVYPGTFFGTTNYTGIAGRAALVASNITTPSNNAVTLTNIVVQDSLGNPIPNYTVVVADADSTTNQETLSYTTNGVGWNTFAVIGNSTTPPITGLNTPTATITGGTNTFNNVLLSTLNPTTLQLRTITPSNILSYFGMAIGFAVTKIEVTKNIGDRIDSNDQFNVAIDGTPTDAFTTIGSSSGVQPETAFVYAIPGNTYIINEAMAAGSGSVLGDYTVVTSASNAIAGGSVPPTGAFPINFTPALGDDVTYNILNASPESFIKTVDKIYADIGDVLTYSVTIQNPNDVAINNVLLTDATPPGTTYIGNLNVTVPYTGVNPATGLTITTIPPNSSAVASWEVQVNTTPPITTPIVNIANVVVPNGTTGVTNVVSTAVRHARIAMTKAVDKAYAEVGDILTYTLTLNNIGNVPANNVIITDAVPAGTTYVIGSLSGTVPFTGSPDTTINLTAPIPGGGTAVINFKVKVNNATPSVNPIPNSATAEYNYTVDPTDIEPKSAIAFSNEVTTLITNAKLSITKNVDKNISYVGDIITYQGAIKNTGNVPLNDVSLTDLLPNGTAYVIGSFNSSVPFTSTSPSTIVLTNSIDVGEVISISFQVKIVSMPNPNPAENHVVGKFKYTIDPTNENAGDGSTTSNTVRTVVLRFDFAQEINDLIESVALQEAALAAIADAEGSKIQKFAAMENISTQELLCLNRSVNDTLESIAVLNKILKQKLTVIECQITPICLL